MLKEEKRLQNGTHFPARRRQYDCNRDAFSVTFLVILVDHNVIRPQPRQSNINFAPISGDCNRIGAGASEVRSILEALCSF